jgi:N-glycosylase/DNA lyase
MSLKETIEKLKGEIGGEVKKALEEFKKNKNLTKESKFLEICFCILVANSSMEKTLRIWKEIGEGFLRLEKEKLAQKLKRLGYRFYNKRAEYIVEARSKIELLEELLKMKDEFKIREELVKNFKGIGWKEASHFLRNLGYKNFAILDRHVLRTVKKFGIIREIPRSLNKKAYFEIEERLREIAESLNISLAELDFYLFYLGSRKFPIK